jgi:hypothetical protein
MKARLSAADRTPSTQGQPGPQMVPVAIGQGEQSFRVVALQQTQPEPSPQFGSPHF